ncbi:MAG: 3'-5' exonuclease [Oscillospiraceae bacterium]|nr:3'-5' exonuclease [Oscillospiraceae bacterium]
MQGFYLADVPRGTSAEIIKECSTWNIVMIWIDEQKLKELKEMAPEHLRVPEIQRAVAFDVETPNGKSERMCSIGITVIEKNTITKSVEYRINPEQDFDWFCVKVHGITQQEAEVEPIFPEVWPKIRAELDTGLVLAHNARFDLNVLRKCLYAYDIEFHDVQFADTVEIARVLLGKTVPNHKLGTLCDWMGIPLDAHHAGSDSYGCAKIYLNLLEEYGPLSGFERTFHFL